MFSTSVDGLTSALAVTANTIIKYDTVIYDTDTAYATGTGLFTVPTGKGGTYLITCVGFSGGTVANIYVKVGSTNKGVLFTTISTTASGSFPLPLSAGDTVGLYPNATSTFNAIDGTLGYLNRYSIHRIGT